MTVIDARIMPTPRSYRYRPSHADTDRLPVCAYDTRMGGRSPLSVPLVLAAGALLGAAIGFGSSGLTPQGRAAMVEQTKAAAITLGVKRARAPRTGDDWGGCNDARRAGTAPIYRGEPGYRSDMDGDNDGIACEPHRE